MGNRADPDEQSTPASPVLPGVFRQHHTHTLFCYHPNIVIGNFTFQDLATMTGTYFPTQKDIEKASARIEGIVHRTPVFQCNTLNILAECKLFFKCENFQKVGAFKFRGASNALLSMDDGQLSHGVATHSSGNHAQALALAAQIRKVPAFIVMPENAPLVKRQAVKGYGAEIINCAPTLKSREETLSEVIRKTGAAFVHPYNDYNVICGQATCARELIEDIPDLDIIIAPVGGGGLLSGTALSTHYYSAATKVIASEPSGADDAWRSLQAGRIIPSENPDTIADGLLTSLGEKTFPIIRQFVDSILRVEDDATISAMRLIWERMKTIVEPSAAVSFGAVLTHPDDFKGKRVGIIISGGNVDLEHLPW
jgi:threonine dehydratase